MDFGLYEMKIVRNNPSSVKSDPRLTRTNDLSPLGSDLSEVYCIYIYIHTHNRIPSFTNSGQCSTTGVTKAVICAILHIKEPLLLIGKSSLWGGSGFPLSLSSPLPYV